MRYILTTVFLLMLAAQSGAETYSWVDDSGTYNFTEDLSQVPKKYRKKVIRRGNMGNHDSAPVNASPEKGTQSEPRKVEDFIGKPVGQPLVGGTQLYGGKTQDEWRKELKDHETELTRLEQQIEQIRKQITTPARLSRESQAELVKEYENARQSYNQKYKLYSDLIESARKAGLIIEIKK